MLLSGENETYRTGLGVQGENGLTIPNDSKLLSFELT